MQGGSRRLAVSTAAFGAATAVSRVAGVLREVVAASLLGSGAAMSAFQIAFNVPNLIRTLVADTAISAAFVPVFVELRERGEEPAAWRVASMVLWLCAVVLGALSALFVLLAPVVMPLFVLGDDNVSIDLVVRLSRWMFPIVVLLGMTGVVVGILNSYGIFGVPALAPLAWNATIVAALLLFARAGSPEHRVEVYAIGVLVATVVQFLIPLPLLGGRRRGLAFAVGWRNPYVRRILKLMLPITIGLGLINVNLTLDLAIGSLASDHAVSDLNYAFRVFMLPQGLFSVAVTSVMFPEIARLVARGEREALTARIAEGIRAIVFLLLPASAVMFALAEPAVRVLYERGAFTASDTAHVADTLRVFSIALVFNGLSLLLTRAFFAMQEARVPTLVAAVNLALNVVLDLALYRPFGAAGIAGATVLVTAFNAIVLAHLLRARVGSLHAGEVARESGRIALAAVPATVAAIAVWQAAARLAGDAFVAEAVGLALAAAAATGAYLAAGRALGLPEMDLIASIVRRRR